MSRASEKSMSLSGHLKELRNRLLVCVGCLLGCFLAALSFASVIVEHLTDIGNAYGYTFVYLAPQELLLQHFSIALIASVCVTLPVILYNVWAFIRPGLKENENRLFLLALATGLLCFVIGVLFAYEIMMPFMLHFLIGVSTGSGITAAISIEKYISFLLTIFVIFGIIFEMPVVTVTLSQMRILKIEWMKKARRVMIILIFIVSAIITPPDIVSQIMVAIPMIGLYELSILLSSVLLGFAERKQGRKRSVLKMGVKSRG